MCTLKTNKTNQNYFRLGFKKKITTSGGFLSQHAPLPAVEHRALSRTSAGFVTGARAGTNQTKEPPISITASSEAETMTRDVIHGGGNSFPASPSPPPLPLAAFPPNSRFKAPQARMGPYRPVSRRGRWTASSPGTGRVTVIHQLMAD